MVFVEDDEVPVDFVNPLIPRLDRTANLTKQILERTEVNERHVLGHRARITPSVAREVAPPVEIDMIFKIGTPSVFNGGLERHYKYTFRAQFLRELVAGERLAEAHLGVPQESRDGLGVLIPP